MFVFSIGAFTFEWNGAHTVNVFNGGHNVDAFSLNYERDDYTDKEVMGLAYDWMYGW